MAYKNIWTEKDFDEMSFHDCRIYSIGFPDEKLKLNLDIDYLFEWILDEERNTYNFLVAPCSLVFDSVFNLRISIDFGDAVGLDILSITKSDLQYGINNTLAEYLVETDKGRIEFKTTGYVMKVSKPLVLSSSQVLGRE